MQYSLQINAHGNRIVCKGTEVRNSYQIMFIGTYADCQAHGTGDLRNIPGVRDMIAARKVFI